VHRPHGGGLSAARSPLGDQGARAALSGGIRCRWAVVRPATPLTRAVLGVPSAWEGTLRTARVQAEIDKTYSETKIAAVTVPAAVKLRCAVSQVS